MKQPDGDLTIVMLSQLCEGDGGRETWLKNFLTETVRQGRAIRLHIFHRTATSGSTLLDAPGVGAAVSSVTSISCGGGPLPVTVGFLMESLRFRWRKGPLRGAVLTVGGLSDALGTLALAGLAVPREHRILWLRTIYSKEKAHRIPRLLRGTLLRCELFLIRHCFGLVLANGDDTAAFYRAHGVPCTVVKNAVPLDVWRMPPRASGARLRIAFIGRLAEVKGIGTFLEAVELAHTSGESHRFEFFVAGEGPFRHRVEALAAAGRLTYCGQLESSAVLDLVGKVDCCVALTVLSDELGGGGVSNALLEQMAASRILVAWDNPIFRAVIGPEQAYLVQQGSSSGLLAAFVAAHTRPQEARSKALAASAASELYSIAQHVDRFFEVVQPIWHIPAEKV